MRTARIYLQRYLQWKVGFLSQKVLWIIGELGCAILIGYVIWYVYACAAGWAIVTGHSYK